MRNSSSPLSSVSPLLWLRRVRAFVARDFQLAVSYRLEFFMRVLWILLIVTTLFFISQIFAGSISAQYPQWRDPLPAWITGFAVLNYFMTGFSSLANAIRSEQQQGTLESVLMTPINIPTLITASSVWDFINVTFTSFLYFFFGWLFFGVTYKGNFAVAALLLILTTLVLASFGILSASFTMVFKRGDPFGILIGISSAFFSGVFFPTQLLGSAFGTISKALPATYGLDGIRRVLIEGQTLREVREPLLILCLFLGILMPFALWVFSRAVRRAKREGSLIQY